MKLKIIIKDIDHIINRPRCRRHGHKYTKYSMPP